MDELARLKALLAKAKSRNDRLAIANLEGQIRRHVRQWTEAELRAAWGDR